MKRPVFITQFCFYGDITSPDRLLWFKPHNVAPKNYNLISMETISLITTSCWRFFKIPFSSWTWHDITWRRNLIITLARKVSSISRDALRSIKSRDNGEDHQNKLLFSMMSFSGTKVIFGIWCRTTQSTACVCDYVNTHLTFHSSSTSYSSRYSFCVIFFSFQAPPTKFIIREKCQQNEAKSCVKNTKWKLRTMELLNKTAEKVFLNIDMMDTLKLIFRILSYDSIQCQIPVLWCDLWCRLCEKECRNPRRLDSNNERRILLNGAIKLRQ